MFSALLRPMSYYRKRAEASSTSVPTSDKLPALGCTGIKRPLEEGASTSSLASEQIKDPLIDKILMEDEGIHHGSILQVDKTNNNLLSSREFYGSVYSLSMAAPFSSTHTINAEDNSNSKTADKHKVGAVLINTDTTKTSSQTRGATSQEETATGFCHQYWQLCANYKVSSLSSNHCFDI